MRIGMNLGQMVLTATWQIEFRVYEEMQGMGSRPGLAEGLETL